MTSSRRTRTRRSSLGDRITHLVLGTSAIAILLVTAVLSAANHAWHKQVAFESLRAQAEIAALNSAAPMGFGDVETAAEVLHGLGTIENVSSATLFKLDGTLFAYYAAGEPQLQHLEPGEADGRLVVVLQVEERSDQLGSMQVVYDLGPLRGQLLRNLLLSALIGAIALGLSALAARKGARLLVRRLERLDQTAAEVSDSRDYSVRAPVEGNDEIAGFTHTFNEMLAQIELQDEQLRASRQEALVASRLKDEFLATLSHELRTPMTPIAGWAQMLPRLAEGHPQVAQASQVIGRNALAMTRIIDDLLDMSRIISGKIRLEVTLFPFAQVLEDAIESVRLAAEARDIAVTREVAPGLLLRGDPHRIGQVLWNLLANAVKFTPPGGTVAVHARVVDGAVRVDVRDSGIGIAPDFVPHVFDRFRQADSSVTRPYGGLGLGLAIARELVELHGGSISASSDGDGQGACFTFTLPLPREWTPAPGDGPGLLAEISAAASPLAGVRVALVEDDADARALVTAILTSHGASVRSAASATEGLALIDSDRPDVLVSDIGMQGQDGYWLAGQLRRRPEDQSRRLPAIALTAFAGEADRERAIAAGFDEHVAKPIDEQALVRAVARSARAAPSGPAV